MSAQQPEYIITEEQIGDILENAYDLRKMHDLVAGVMLHPHTQAPEPARAERTLILNEIEELLISNDHLPSFKWELRKKIELLRGKP